jgi:hypothetical protein
VAICWDEEPFRGEEHEAASLPIADCRLTIEKVVWQLLPMSISPAEREQSKIGNSRAPEEVAKRNAHS